MLLLLVTESEDLSDMLPLEGFGSDMLVGPGLENLEKRGMLFIDSRRGIDVLIVDDSRINKRWKAGLCMRHWECDE